MTQSRKNTKEQNDFQNEIQLLGIYLDEWQHRDDIYWRQMYKYFYFILIVDVLPYVNDAIIDIPAVLQKAFPIIGLIMSIVFLYVGMAYTYRTDASRNTCVKIMDLLPTYYRQTKIKELTSPCAKLFTPGIAKVVLWIMFICLFVTPLIILINY